MRAVSARLLRFLFVLIFLLPGLGRAEDRVVAVGDIHGDYDAAVTILRQAHLLDQDLRWAGGKTTFVQTGDYLDRGPRSRAVLDLLMTLPEQAGDQGGKAIILLGNHEVMNMVGDLRYVSPEGFAEFAGPRSEELRNQAWEKYLAWRQKRARVLGQEVTPVTREEKDQWMAQHPAGFFEQREAFSPRGPYGKWLRQRDAVARVGDTIFLHGGISPQLSKFSLDDINRRVRDELGLFDQLREYLVESGVALPFFTLQELLKAANEELQVAKAAPRPDQDHIQRLETFVGQGGWIIFHPDGPLWFRGYAEWSEEEGAPLVDAVLKTYGVKHLVVGHTPQPGEIRSRFGAKVFLIDTGMLASYYGGQPSALEIGQDRFTAIYRDRQAVLSGPPADAAAADPPQAAPSAMSVWLDADGKPLPFANEDELMDFLRTADVTSLKWVSKGVTNPRKCTLEKNGIRMHAIFRDVNQTTPVMKFATGEIELNFRDSAIFEVAAFHLSRLLGLDNIPPVVVRKVAGTTGSIQVWLEHAMTEETRVKDRKVDPPDVISWNRQVQIMRVFDALVFNTDRNAGNILIDSGWKLWMIDHTRAFRRRVQIDESMLSTCDRRLYQALRDLDEKQAYRELKPYLNKSEIKAILQRRDKLVEYFDKAVRERGESAVLFDFLPPAAGQQASVETRKKKR